MTRGKHSVPVDLLPQPNTPFGHPLRGLWSLDPGIRFLNHGSFGAAPRYVLAARGRLAGFVGAVSPKGTSFGAPQRLTFVENATAGANAVLRSLRWQAGERIVIADHAYPGVKNAVRFVAERFGLELVGQARAAADIVADAWRVAPGAPLGMVAAMVTLPLPVEEAGTEEAARRWRKRLLDEHRIEVPLFPVNGRLWLRFSAQVYNELSDYEALARVFG